MTTVRDRPTHRRARRRLRLALAAAAVLTIGAVAPAHAARITGTEGPDWLDGTTGNDSIYLYGVDDHAVALDGNDIVDGGPGHDTLVGDADSDAVLGGIDRLFGGDGNDALLGSGGGDELHGGSGNDSIGGEHGDDDIWGDEGDDWLRGDAGHDMIIGGPGNDSISGGPGNDEISGGIGVDTLSGGEGNDQIGVTDSDRADAGSGDDEVLISQVASGASVYCGDGYDSVTFLTYGWLVGSAQVDSSCERVTSRPLKGDTSYPTPPGPEAS